MYRCHDPERCGCNRSSCQSEDLASICRACGNNPNPYLSFRGHRNITRKDQTGSSNYNALQASLRQSVGGLQLNVAYTYSHSIDDSSDYNDSGFVDSYNLNAYRASSNFDERHIFNIGYVYDLPFFKNKGLANRVLGWVAVVGHHRRLRAERRSAFITRANVQRLNGPDQHPETMPECGKRFATAASYPDLVGDPRSGVPNVVQPGIRAFAVQSFGFRGSHRTDLRKRGEKHSDQSLAYEF